MLIAELVLVRHIWFFRAFLDCGRRFFIICLNLCMKSLIFAVSSGDSYRNSSGNLSVSYTNSAEVAWRSSL